MTGPLAGIFFTVIFLILALEFAAVWLALVVGCACFGAGVRRLLAEKAGRGRRLSPGALLAAVGLALCIAGITWMAVRRPSTFLFF